MTYRWAIETEEAFLQDTEIHNCMKDVLFLIYLQRNAKHWVGCGVLPLWVQQWEAEQTCMVSIGYADEVFLKSRNYVNQATTHRGKPVFGAISGYINFWGWPRLLDTASKKEVCFLKKKKKWGGGQQLIWLRKRQEEGKVGSFSSRSRLVCIWIQILNIRGKTQIQLQPRLHSKSLSQNIKPKKQILK